MASYFYLNLDTTGPVANVYAPNYTTKTAENYITIEANEELSTYQELYIIDQLGVRHDLTLMLDQNKYVGIFVFNDYPLGVATLYARVKDSVENISNLASKSFNIMEINAFVVTVSDYVAGLDIEIKARELDMEVIDDAI